MVFLAAIVLFVFAAALMRSFGHPLIWSVELAQLLLCWVSMLGANMALRRDEHVGVDVLVRHLPERARLKLDIALFVLVIAALVTLIIYGIRLVLLNPERTLGAVQLPYAWVDAAIPVGATLMLVTSCSRLLARWQRLRHHAGVEDGSL
jgi:TRAP-type C4-dicarboxylate transport system permease small subunit